MTPNNTTFGVWITPPENFLNVSRYRGLENQGLRIGQEKFLNFCG